MTDHDSRSIAELRRELRHQIEIGALDELRRRERPPQVRLGAMAGAIPHPAPRPYWLRCAQPAGNRKPRRGAGDRRLFKGAAVGLPCLISGHAVVATGRGQYR